MNKTLAYNLASDGYEVTGVLNIRTAAAKLTACEYDLVLLDINLPDGRGYELCKLIKPDYPDTLVIFLTANDQERSDIIRLKTEKAYLSDYGKYERDCLFDSPSELLSHKRICSPILIR